MIFSGRSFPAVSNPELAHSQYLQRSLRPCCQQSRASSQTGSSAFAPSLLFPWGKYRLLPSLGGRSVRSHLWLRIKNLQKRPIYDMETDKINGQLVKRATQTTQKCYQYSLYNPYLQPSSLTLEQSNWYLFYKAQADLFARRGTNNTCPQHRHATTSLCADICDRGAVPEPSNPFEQYKNRYKRP
ncbi:UNVERIFIED_CONTAM: hypothetical protein FKN15_051527 [Acipenser sinensis]